MKQGLGLTAVVVVGLWAGFQSWHSASFMQTTLAGLAMFVGSTLLFSLWLWYRAEPDSGDAMVLPTVVLVSASTLVGILPRLLWPQTPLLHFAGSMVGLIGSVVFAITAVRRRRRLRRAA